METGPTSPNIPPFPDTHDEADRLAYFQMVYEGFLRAEGKTGSFRRYFDVAGQTICLRFAGPALIPQVTPAMDHIAAAPTSTPSLTICLWDCVSTRTKMPLLVSSLIQTLQQGWYDTLSPRREIKGYHGDRIRTIFHYGPSILTLMDTRQDLAIYWLHDAEALPYYEKGYPFTTILNWWMENQELQCVHAAAVGTAGGGVLLPGKSGSGKSTTALTCLNSALSYVSDDTCVVTGCPQPYAYSLYNTAKLVSEEDIARLPHLAATVINPNRIDGEKAMILVNRHYPEKIVKGFPIKAVLTLLVTGKPETKLRPATAGTALKALAPSTIMQLPGAGQKALRLISMLLRQVPCYVLELGTDLPRIPEVIADLLSGT